MSDIKAGDLLLLSLNDVMYDKPVVDAPPDKPASFSTFDAFDNLEDMVWHTIPYERKVDGLDYQFVMGKVERITNQHVFFEVATSWMDIRIAKGGVVTLPHVSSSVNTIQHFNARVSLANLQFFY